jgi:hypothetical protein
MDESTGELQHDRLGAVQLTPSSLSVCEEEIEEVVRIPPQIPRAASFASSRPRSMRPPIRRRIRIEEFPGKTYKMFEISTMGSRSSIEGSDVSSTSAITMVSSATSSNGDPWSSSGWVEEEDDADINWDQEDDGDVVPKIEPIDDVDMADFSDMKESETTSSASTPAQAKRPRGRPRKHPKPTAESMAKIAKGRSKTGCITCRRRKKKCDETKPGCK